MKPFAFAALAGLAFFNSVASANTLPAARYAEMMTVEVMDTNKDGMVSVSYTHLDVYKRQAFRFTWAWPGPNGIRATAPR